MDCSNPDSKSLIEERTLEMDNVKYKYIIQLENLKIKITFMINRLSPNIWEKEYTLEELRLLSPVFQLSKDEESIYEIVKNCLQKVVSVKFQDKVMKLTISLHNFSKNCSFPFELTQTDINMDQFLQEYQMTKILDYQDIQPNGNANSFLKKLFPIKIKSKVVIQICFLFLFWMILLTLLYRYGQSINDQLNKYQETNQKEIDLLQHSVQLLSSDIKEQHRKQEDTLTNNVEQINQQSIQITLLSSEFKKQTQDIERIDSKIIISYETKMIEYWNYSGIKKIKFDLIYRATRDGFQIEKLYEKCANKQDVLVLIKSNLGKRFGFYSDKEIKNYNGYLPSNPNKIYLFSFDTFTKYTSNNQNCQQAFVGTSSGIGVGYGHDLFLSSNSHLNILSYNNPQHTYGVSQGLGNTYLSGASNFSTLEVEVFQLSFE